MCFPVNYILHLCISKVSILGSVMSCLSFTCRWSRSVSYQLWSRQRWITIDSPWRSWRSSKANYRTGIFNYTWCKSTWNHSILLVKVHLVFFHVFCYLANCWSVFIGIYVMKVSTIANVGFLLICTEFMHIYFALAGYLLQAVGPKKSSSQSRSCPVWSPWKTRSTMDLPTPHQSKAQVSPRKHLNLCASV